MSHQYSWPIYGHQEQIEYLQKSIDQNSLAKSYLFYGPKGLGKKTIALLFAKSLFCSDKNEKPCNICYNCRLIQNRTFSNLYVLGTDDQALNAENIRNFLQGLALSGVGDQNKLAIIFGLERANLHGANALLKTLEEPPANTTIILVADSLDNMPSTVISRCQLLKFKSLSNEDMAEWLSNYEFNEEENKTITNLSFGKPGVALELMKDNLEEYKKAAKFVIKLLSSNTFQYMSAIDRWFSVLKKEYPNFKIYELGSLTTKYLDLFEVILRDILWLKFDRPIANEFFKEELTTISKKIDQEVILKNLLSISKMREKLSNNVSPQLLWENLLLNVNIKI